MFLFIREQLEKHNFVFIPLPGVFPNSIDLSKGDGSGVIPIMGIQSDDSQYCPRSHPPHMFHPDPLNDCVTR